MKVICTKGCNKVFENPEFKEEKLEYDVREIYFRCPHCGKKYTCFYTDREIRKLQALQRKTGDINEFNNLKEKVTERMNKLKDRMNFYEEIRIGNEKSGEYTINTIKPRNSNIFETAIMLTELGEWHIVEEYKTKEDAIKGHKKYCSMAVNELDKII